MIKYTSVIYSAFGHSAFLQHASAFGQAPSTFLQQESGFWHSAFLQHVSAFGQAPSTFLQQESGFWHSAFGHVSAFGHSVFWQHSTAGLSQHLPSLQAAFLQQPIAATAMAAISKIFFITLKKYKN